MGISLRYALFAVKEDDFFLLFILFLIGHNAYLGMCASSSLLLLSPNSEIPKFPFNLASLSGLPVFSVSFFSRSYSYSSLSSFCSTLIVYSSSFSLGAMIGVLGFVLCLVTP